MLKQSKDNLEKKEKAKYGQCLVDFTRVWSHLDFDRSDIIYYSGYFVKICQDLDNNQ